MKEIVNSKACTCEAGVNNIIFITMRYNTGKCSGQLTVTMIVMALREIFSVRQLT